MPDGGAAPRELYRLTSLRAWAAAAVFGYHLNTLIRWRPLHLFQSGQAGVEFFFILSGFVLAWSTPATLPAGAFYRRRFARIYPATALMTIATAVWLAADPSPRFTTAPWALLATLLLVQAWIGSAATPFAAFTYNAPTWSLSVEAWCYAIFPWVARRLRTMAPRTQLAIAAVALGVAAVVTAAFAHGVSAYVVFVNPLIRSAEFVLGIVLALRVRAGRRSRLPMWAAVTLVVFLGLFAWRLPFPTMNYLLTVPFALLIVAAATADLKQVGGFLTHPVSRYLGRVSFAFYLVQWPVTVGVLDAMGVVGHKYSVLAGLGPAGIAALASVGAAMLVHHGVELPMQRLLRPRPPRAVDSTAPISE